MNEGSCSVVEVNVDEQPTSSYPALQFILPHALHDYSSPLV